MTEKETQNKETKKETEADKIWNDISNLSISMYAIQNKTVGDYLEKLPVPGKVLYVRPKAPAVIAALGDAIGDGFKVEATEKGYFQITRVDQLPDVEDDHVVFRRNGKEERIPRTKLHGSDS